MRCYVCRVPVTWFDGPVMISDGQRDYPLCSECAPLVVPEFRAGEHDCPLCRGEAS